MHTENRLNKRTDSILGISTPPPTPLPPSAPVEIDSRPSDAKILVESQEKVLKEDQIEKKLVECEKKLDKGGHLVSALGGSEEQQQQQQQCCLSDLV